MLSKKKVLAIKTFFLDFQEGKNFLTLLLPSS